MSKYNPLWEYLKSDKNETVELSFNQIQNILGFPIDHSFLNYKKEARTYGYNVKKIFLKEKRIIFVRYED